MTQVKVNSLPQEASSAKPLAKPMAKLGPVAWHNVFLLSIIHLAAVIGWWQVIAGRTLMSTFVFHWAVAQFSGFGILVGAHRLWSHRSFKAHWSLRVLLMIMFTVAFENDLFWWTREHRQHHKYSESDWDPHDSRRGFFYSHIGWLFYRRTPEFRVRRKNIDMSDISADPVVRFNVKYYYLLVLVFWGIIPVSVPVFVFGESIVNAILSNFFRYVLGLHHTFMVNSAAHLWGGRPYDKRIAPAENLLVAYMANGEGYHNYHHTFPWDYSASEFRWKTNFNPSTAFIEMSQKLGLAYDLKRPSNQMLEARIKRTGDLSLARGLSSAATIIDLFRGMFVFTWPLWFTSVLNCTLFYSNLI